MGAQGGQRLPPLEEVGFLDHWTVAWNHGVEIEFQHASQRLIPFDDAAARAVIDKRRAAIHEEIAGVERTFGGKLNYSVAVGVASADVPRQHFLAAQEDLRFVRKSDAWEAGHLSRKHVSAGILVDDDLGGRGQHGFVATGMVAVLMGVEDVADGLVADGFFRPLRPVCFDVGRDPARNQ